MELIHINNKPEEFKITIEGFEGPFDLLLHLIEEDKLDIYNVSISKITADYLAYLHQMQKLDLDIASEFMIMAAILIEMKSKMLLPSDNPANEDLLAEAEAERIALLSKLVEYKAFKALTQRLSEKENENLYVQTRDSINEDLISKMELKKEIYIKNADVDNLLRAFNRVWQEFELRILSREVDHVAPMLYSIKDKMVEIINRLEVSGRVMFSEMFNNINNKFEIIATFISLLELVRQQFILISQHEQFEDIEILANKNAHRDDIVLAEDEYNKVFEVAE